MNQHIEQAIHNFRCSAARYAKTERYYLGEHDLAFATEKFVNAFGTLFRAFAMNLCPAICDAVKDKLRITGFGVNHTGRNTSVSECVVAQTDDTLPDGRVSARNAGSLTSQIDRIWHRNRMPQRAGEIHKEALKNGDAYAVVWFDALGNVTIYPEHAAKITVTYDEGVPGRILWAAKYWRTADKHTRLNIFYPDRIERFVTKKQSETALTEASEFVPLGQSAGFSPSEEIRTEAGTLTNPFGVVPVFHFANNADVGSRGRSELEPAIPIQDGLNKSILDMLVAMEFSAFRQRWVTGLEVEYDDAGEPALPFRLGADRLWTAGNPAVNFGEFNTTDLDQFLKVKDSFRVDMASVTGTPLHYFLQTTRAIASGESLKQNETRFLAKVRDRQESFGQVWAELMSFALRLAGCGEGIELITQWQDPAPTSEKDILENILLKKQIGLSSELALKEAGYGDLDVERMTN